MINLDEQFLINNLWVIIAALLVFIMTVAVGFLEVGELGSSIKRSLFKTILISGTSLFVMGIIGFNPGSVLAFNGETLVVVINTFLAAGTAMLSTIGFRWIDSKRYPDILDSVNGILMGLIIITPLAGFVSPVSSIILGFLGGPLFIYAEKTLSKIKWMDDPVGLLPGHATGGLFGVVMIAFFTQKIFASASGNPTLPNGLLFGGGYLAVKQLGIEFFGIVVVIIFVFVVSYFCLWVIGKVSGGITY